MKKIILFIIYLFSGSIYAQQWDWANQEGEGQYDNVGSLATDKIGNTYMTGRTGGSSGHIILNKYDSGGVLLWTKILIGDGNDDASSVAVDVSGYVYITGSLSSSTLSFDSIVLTKQSYSDIFLAKYNPNGNVVWAKRAGGNNPSWGSGASSVTTDLVGNVYICGSFTDLMLTFDNITVYNLYQGTIPNQTPNRNLFLVKYDTNGNVLWAQVAGGNYNDADPADASFVTTDNVGNVYMTGGFACTSITFGTHVLVLQNSTNKGGDMFVAKYDKNGNAIWAKSAGNVAGVWGASMAVDVSANIYVVGNFASYTLTFDSITLINPQGSTCCWYGSQYTADFIVKYDNNGNVVWAKSLNINNGGQSTEVITDACNKIYVTGCKSDSVTHSLNMFLSHLDASGNILFTINAGGDNNIGTALSLDQSGKVFVAGNFRNGSILLTPYLLNNSGSKQMFIAKLTTNGDFMPAAPSSSDKTICAGNSAFLSASGIGTISWYDNATTGNYLGGGLNFTTPTLMTNTSYYVQDSTCIASVTRTMVLVTVNPSSGVTTFPNVVTPNGDKINDCIDFSIYQFTSLQLEIYNRWGNKVFESNEPNCIWKPTCDDGTYFYVAQYQIGCSNEIQNKNLKGFITVIR